MSYSCLTAFSYIFLWTSIGAEILSFLTSHMLDHTIIDSKHEGIFQRCFIGCYWLDARTFDTDRKSMQMIVIVSFLSLGVLALSFLFSFIGLIERFKTKALYRSVGLMMFLNAIILAFLIGVYTLVYAKETRLFSGPSIEKFSYSYWLLYVAIAGNLLCAVLMMCHPSGDYGLKKLRY